jgi:hypothetical protein
MATEATIRRWDQVLDEVEKTRKGSPFINLLAPGYKQFDQGFRLTVATITKAFGDAWHTDRPAQGSALHAVLKPIARAADEWDFEQPAEPQVDKFMGVVTEAPDAGSPRTTSARRPPRNWSPTWRTCSRCRSW